MKRLRGPGGSVAVEFALIAPLLLTLVFGIIEFGLVLYNKAIITNAGREGARAAIIFRASPVDGSYAPASEEEVRSIVNQYVQQRLVTFDPLRPAPTVEADPTADFADLDGSGALSSGDERWVTVSWTYDFLVLPNLVTTLSGGLPMNATTRMRME